MARIRSIHPGFWTDEETMRLTVDNPMALLVIMGLWGEADDHGVFEWKPFTLKARTMPAPPIDFDGLLSVLADRKFIKRVTIDGRELGAVRNFMVWQRPRRPTFIYPVTDDILQFVGLKRSNPDDDGNDDGSTEPIPDIDGKVSADGEESRSRREGEEGSESETLTAVREWNEAAPECGLARVQHLTEKRKRKVPARLKELGGIDGWRAMLSKIRGSPFLKGKNPQGWKASFDWVLEPANLTKIMEGNYDSRGPTNAVSGAMHDLRERIRESGDPPGHDGRGQFTDEAAAG